MSSMQQVDATGLKAANTGQERATSEHPFLSGIYRPMSEELTIDELNVEGELPACLRGRYVRIGPNPVHANPDRYHWFAGDGMIHGIAIGGGRALWYRNRWIRSASVAAALGEPAAPGPRHPRNDVVNTNVIGLAGETWALVESGSFPVMLSGDLERQAYSAFGDTLSGSYSAHPHRDEQTGYLHAIAYEGGVLTTIRHVVVSPQGKVVREEPIMVEDGPSIHDCAVTERYVVILNLPVTFSIDAARRGMGFPFRWNPNHRARVGLLLKEGSGDDVVWCDVDPCYVFHTGNAWETPEGEVILDVIAYKTMFDGEAAGPGGRCLGLERWTIEPHSRQVRRRLVSAISQEFPRYDERRSGRPTRFLYTIASPDDIAAQPSRIYKHDVEQATYEMYDFGAGQIPGEFVFVPEDGNGPEDAGWMIGFVLDAVLDKTDFVVLNAAKFSEPPVARIRLPHRIPPGFHGNWIANESFVQTG